ncbi:MAG TPA: efflux RND transporter periplasmic adaptor subunit [Anaeromyxobacteraceae bacterium]|nr:efflux RND transporter periplasmic adaptor subunit [Anaeromyxobacteraceae bacterium]
MKSKNLQRIVVIAGLLAVTGILVGIKGGQILTMVRAGESFVPPPESVSSAKVEAAEWETTRSAIGSLVALHGVTLGAELPGTVRQITFESGTLVKRGAVLVRLDTSAEEAQLSVAVADAAFAHLTLERARRLRQSEVNAQADLDAAVTRAAQADGTVANLKAIIAKKTIRAPFDGRIAIRQVELGQVVSPGTQIASIQSVTPIHADFWLPQQALAELRQGQRTRLRIDAFPGADWEGEITTVNSEVDPATRNVRVRATFQNGDGRLRPGMFANVEVLSSERRSVLAIPATAVIFAPYGDSVFAIEEKKDQAGKTVTVARQAFVQTGERRGDLVAVLSGLKAGDTVVSSGAFKLRNGGRVAVNNALAPEASLSPKPANE